MQITDEDLKNTPIFRSLLAERGSTHVFLTSYRPVADPLGSHETLPPLPRRVPSPPPAAPAPIDETLAFRKLVIDPQVEVEDGEDDGVIEFAPPARVGADHTEAPDWLQVSISR